MNSNRLFVILLACWIMTTVSFVYQVYEKMEAENLAEEYRHKWIHAETREAFAKTDLWECQQMHALENQRRDLMKEYLKK